MHKLKILLICALTFIAVSLSSCDYQRLDTLITVAGVGIDKTATGYHLTLEAVTSAGDSKGGAFAPMLLSGDGDTIWSAVDEIMSQVSGKIYLNHCEVVVISSEVASSGISQIVQNILQSSDFNINTDIFVANGASAADILSSTPTNDDIVSFELMKMLQVDKKYVSVSTNTTPWQLNSEIASQTSVSALPLVYLTKNADKETAQIGGVALLKAGKLTGTLNTDDTLGYLFVTNKIGGGVVEANSGQNDNIISARIISSNTKYSLDKSGLQTGILLKISTQLSLLSSSKLPNNTSSDLQNIQNIYNNYIANLVKNLVNEKRQEFGIDIFNFAEKLPQGTLTDNIPVTVSVKSKIVDTRLSN